MSNTPLAHDEIERLLRITAAMRAGKPVHADDAAWFGDGVGRCFDDKGSLDECLGISAWKQGSRHGAHMYNAQQRNIHLVAAHRVCSGDVSSWKRSLALAVQVEAFHVIWPTLLDKEIPDKAWSQLKTALFMAFKFGSKYEGGLPPKSHNRLHEIYLQHEQK